MKICVTGGAGFIASYFFDVLRAAGHQLSILDLVEPTWDVQGSRVTVGDIRDAEAVDRALDGCDALLHLAAAHHDFGIAEHEYFDVNEHGAEVLCAGMERAGIKSVCFYSTVAVYGDAPEPRTETTPPEPVSPYGKSKLAAEKVFRAWTEADAGRKCLVIRPTVTFGPRNFANMYSLIRQVKSGKFLPIGDGRNVKSLSYVENIVDASCYLWNPGGAARFDAAFDVFNYIDKPDLTSAEIVESIYKGLGRRAPRMRVPLPVAIVLGIPFDVVIKVTGKNLPVSTARMKKLCTQTKFEADKVLAAGFKPKHTLRQGIANMVEWYLAEGQHKQPAHAVSAG